MESISPKVQRPEGQSSEDQNAKVQKPIPVIVARIKEPGSLPSILHAALYSPPPEMLRVRVVAVGISQQVRNRAEADHPETKHWDLPIDPSMDGVVQDDVNGDLYYALPRNHFLLTDYTNIPLINLFKLPRNADPIKIAGLSGSWLASWALLTACTGHRVLIIGATTCGGRIAAQLAHWLKAADIIGLDNDVEALKKVAGLKRYARLNNGNIPKPQGIKFVVDFIGGEAGENVLHQINEGQSNTGLKYLPAWGPRAGRPFVIDANMVTQRGLDIVDPFLSVWRLMAPQNVGKLRFAIHMMNRICRAPFEIVAKPMAEVEGVWNEEDFRNLKKVLVLIPSQHRPAVNKK